MKQEEKMKRVALMVGVDRYEDEAFRDLRYSVADNVAKMCFSKAEQALRTWLETAEKRRNARSMMERLQGKMEEADLWNTNSLEALEDEGLEHGGG